jgi:hypothetical protein
MDPATGGTLIAGLKALYDIAKSGKDPAMMAQLLEIQSQVFVLVNENQSLKEESVSLKGRLAEKEEIELRADGAVWRKHDKPDQTFGGFCPNCHSGNGKLIKLIVDVGHIPISRNCSICKFAAVSRWW